MEKLQLNNHNHEQYIRIICGEIKEKNVRKDLITVFTLYIKWKIKFAVMYTFLQNIDQLQHLTNSHTIQVMARDCLILSVCLRNKWKVINMKNQNKIISLIKFYCVFLWSLRTQAMLINSSWKILITSISNTKNFVLKK